MCEALVCLRVAAHLEHFKLVGRLLLNGEMWSVIITSGLISRPEDLGEPLM